MSPESRPRGAPPGKTDVSMGRDGRERKKSMKTALFATLTAISLAAAPVFADTPAAPQQMMTQMQGQLAAMQQMMDRIHNTTDSAERQNLLSEHMQSMQSAMMTMRQMGGNFMMGMGEMGTGGGMGPGGMGPGGMGPGGMGPGGMG